MLIIIQKLYLSVSNKSVFQVGANCVSRGQKFLLGGFLDILKTALFYVLCLIIYHASISLNDYFL